MTEFQQLPSCLRQLRIIIEKVDIYKAKTIAKRKELDEHCTKYWPSLLDQGNGNHDADAATDPQAIARLFVLSQESDTYLAYLHILTQEIRAKDIIALFAAEGLPENEAALKAKEYVVSLSEDWVDLRDMTERSEHALCVIEKQLAMEPQVSTPTEDLASIGAVEERFEIVSTSLHHDLRDAFEAIKRFYPHCVSEKSTEQCERLILRSHCAVLKGYLMLHNLLLGIPESSIFDMLKNTGLSDASAKELADVKWEHMKEDMDFFQKDVDHLKELVQPFLESANRRLHNQAKEHNKEDSGGDKDSNHERQLPTIGALSLGDQGESYDLSSHNEGSEDEKRE
jgi:hypothetical protein